jgi:hypothetical protein
MNRLWKVVQFPSKLARNRLYRAEIYERLSTCHIGHPSSRLVRGLYIFIVAGTIFPIYYGLKFTDTTTKYTVRGM